MDVYTGPYVACQNTDKNSYHTERKCQTEGCVRQGERGGSDKFCGSCGRERTVSQVPITTCRVSDSGRDSFARGRLTNRIVRNLTVNQNTFYPDQSTGEIWGGITDLSHGNIQEDMRCFTDQYAQEVATLREMYGPENVEVRWGVIYDDSEW